MNARRRRIAVVTHNIFIAGGTLSMTRCVVEAIRGSGRYDCDVVSLATTFSDHCSVRLLHPGTWFRGIRAEPWEQRGIPTTHVGCLFAELEFQRYKPRRILDAILAEFDLVVFVAGAAPWGYAARRIDKPVVLWLATGYGADRQNRQRAATGLRRFVLPLMERLCEGFEDEALARADHVLALSDYTKRQFVGKVPEGRLSVAFAGVNTEWFAPSPPVANGPFLSVGRLDDPRKNVTLLFRAYANVRRRFGDASPRLLLVGTSPTTEQLAKAEALGVAPYIDVRENVSAEQLVEAYRESSMFVLSSDEEGLAIVVLEAIATGRPVISTRCGGPESAVEHGRNGLLVPVGDAEGLADAMVALVSDPDRARAMGAASRAIAEEKFSKTVTNRVFLDTFDRFF